MSFIVPALSAIGGGSAWLGAANVALTGYSFLQQREQAKQFEAVGERNVALAGVEARQAELGALDRIRIRRDQARKDVGQQRASFAASGVVVTEGSPLLAYSETLAKAEQDVQAISEQATLDMWRARLGGQINQQQANNLASSTRTGATFDLLSQGLKFGERIATRGSGSTAAKIT